MGEARVTKSKDLEALRKKLLKLKGEEDRQIYVPGRDDSFAKPLKEEEFFRIARDFIGEDEI